MPTTELLLRTRRLTLIAATLQHSEAELSDRGRLEALLGVLSYTLSDMAADTMLDEVAANAARAYDRGGYDNIGFARRAIASVASGDRNERLRQLNLPTLVIHGLDDAMCDVSGGRATAAAIPQSKLVLIKGMGHNLPRGLWPELADHIADIVRLGEARIRR